MSIGRVGLLYLGLLCWASPAAAAKQTYLMQEEGQKLVVTADKKLIKLADPLIAATGELIEAADRCAAKKKEAGVKNGPELDEEKLLLTKSCLCEALGQVSGYKKLEQALLAAYPKLRLGRVVERHEWGSEAPLEMFAAPGDLDSACAEAKKLEARVPQLKEQARRARAEQLKRNQPAIDVAQRYLTLRQKGQCAPAYALTGEGYRQHVKAEQFATDCAARKNVFDSYELSEVQENPDGSVQVQLLGKPASGPPSQVVLNLRRAPKEAAPAPRPGTPAPGGAPVSEWQIVGQGIFQTEIGSGQ